MKRYASDSTFAGDTWHASAEEAKEQAQFEYDAAVGEWKELPPDVADPVAYVLSQNQ